MIAKQNKRKFFVVLTVAIICIAVLASASIVLSYNDMGQNGGIFWTGNGKFDAGNAKSEQLELYSVSSSTSSVEYGTYNAAEHTPAGSPSYAAKGSVSGVKVSLAQGDTLKYNKVIDLSDCTEQNKPEDQLISLCITPDSIGSLDAETIEVWFTDAYDPSNYIVVNIFNSQEGGGLTHSNAYIKAKTPGQQLTGIQDWDPEPRKHVDNIYGFPVRLSFAGLFTNSAYGLNTIADNSINISINYAERQVHSAIHKANATSLVCDLDSSNHFTKLWGGFTTGECFMSVRAGNYVKEKANFVITRVNGEEAKDMYFTDRGLPRVEVDTDVYTADALPEAVVGVPYPLFAAHCISPYDGNLNVIARVKFGSEDIAVNNNAFIPAKAGEYQVIYEATDKYGVVGSSTLTVNAPASLSEMVIADCGYPATCFAGEAINVPTPAVTGGSGIPSVKKTVDFGGNVTVIEGNTYRPTKAGKYTFAFTATDYCGQKTITTHVLNVESGNKPVFTHDAALPHYFVSGEQYVLPELNAYDYTDGSGSPVKSVITISDKEGEKNVRGGKITPVARNNGDIVTVTYTATLAGKSSASVSYDIPTVIVKEGRDVHLDKLLYSPDSSVTSITAKESGTSVAVAKNATVDFINPLCAHGFEFEFRVPKNKANFEELTILLTDSENSLQQCKFVYRRASVGTEFMTEGLAAAVRAAQEFGSDDKFRLSYNAVRNEISFDPESKVVVSPTRTVSGEKFTGFDSGKVYLTVLFGEVSGNSELTVVSVGGQYITDDLIDFVAPHISVMGDAGGSYERGSIVTVSKAVASDCVDYTITFKLTVLDPDRMPVASIDGTLLQDITDCGKEYRIALDKVGAYTVLYTAEDLSENSTDTGSYRIQVVDIGKPVITVNGTVPSKGNVGKQIIVPAATVTDDISENLTLKIYVITAHGGIVELKDRAFTPKAAGKYVIRYWCVDDAGNMQICDYTVTVV